MQILTRGSVMCSNLGNYSGLKLFEYVMVERLIREKMNIDNMQFGFLPGHRNT